MNLALITQDFPPEVGGIETYATELASRFAQECEQFMVIAPDKPTALQVDQDLPYPVYRISASNPFLGVKAMSQAPLIFKKHAIRGVFHTQWQTLPASIFAKSAGWIDRIFVAAHARELLFNPFDNVSFLKYNFERYKRWLLSKVDLFFPVSEYTAGLLRDHGIEDNRIRVVINGTNPQTFHPEDPLIARKKIGIKADKVLLTITRLVSRKGIDTALKSFKEVLAHHPDSCYVIVGDGPQRAELEQLSKHLKIAEAVWFAGRVEYVNLINYYNACDVFVMPSKTEIPNVEGFGLVFLEANACNKPVIGTFSGGIPSAVVNGETGILVEENNENELADGINKLFTDKKLASTMGKKGRNRVLKEANWDITASKLLGFMQNKI